MIITEKQLFCLVTILKESVTGIDIKDQFCIPFDERVKLFAKILNQQSDELKEVKNDTR